jgi:hypothetical protein
MAIAPHRYFAMRNYILHIKISSASPAVKRNLPSCGQGGSRGRRSLAPQGRLAPKGLARGQGCMVVYPQQSAAVKIDGGVESPISALGCISKSLRRT